MFGGFRKTLYLCTRKNGDNAVDASGSGLSAVGSAHVWGARGRWFESSSPDQEEKAESRMTLSLFSVNPSRPPRRGGVGWRIGETNQSQMTVANHAQPLPSPPGGGVGGGVSNLLSVMDIQTPPLTPPLGGEGSGCAYSQPDLLTDPGKPPDKGSVSLRFSLSSPYILL